MNNIQFESFDEFCLRLNEDEKGIFGSLIDKTKSFIPRVMRFEKAKSVMKSYLKGFEKKSLSLIKHFEKNIALVAEKAYENFQKFKEDNLKETEATQTNDKAVNLAISYKKDIASLKENELKKINAYIDKVLDSYTNAIDKRIDSPGFILNVELSDRGKGKLKAKWVELSSMKKMEIDEKLLQLLGNAGLNKLDEINAELESYIEEHKYSYGAHALDFRVHSITDIDDNKYKVEIILRAPGRRYPISEKGLLIFDNEIEVTDIDSATIVDYRGALVFGNYTMEITASPTSYIRPYLKIAGSIVPKLGAPVNIGELATHVEKKTFKPVSVGLPEIDYDF